MNQPTKSSASPSPRFPIFLTSPNQCQLSTATYKEVSIPRLQRYVKVNVEVEELADGSWGVISETGKSNANQTMVAMVPIPFRTMLKSVYRSGKIVVTN